MKGCVAAAAVTSEFSWLQTVVGRPGPEAKSHFVPISQQSLPSKTLLDSLKNL